MTRKNKILIVLAPVIISILLLCIFYYRIAIGFGEASVKTIKVYDEIKRDLENKGIKPIDTISTHLNDLRKKDSIENYSSEIKK